VSAIGALVVLLAPGRARAEGPVVSHVRASILAEGDAVRPGRALTLGIRLEMQSGWHTYWRNPGDSGLATRVRWQLPAGFEAGEIRWPYPARFATGPLVSYGYAHEVLLPVEVRVPLSIEGREVRIAGRVDWLECLEICVPGKAELSLSLPVRAEAAPGPHAGLFARARRRLPVRDPAWRFSASASGPVYSLSLRPPRPAELRGAYFYPVTPGLLEHASPQELKREGASYRLALARDPNGARADRLAGVLVADTAQGTLALEVDVPLASGPARASNPQERRP
jgi:DsbC/DsbD-like thiol-disulfide interchange protein